MKTSKLYKFIFLIILLISCKAYSNDNAIKTIYNLSGYWKFNVGDNLEWAKPAFNDENWDKIMVPAKWEDEGYYGLDGFAWYRKTFKMPEYYNEEMFYLYIEKIDDSDEIYINGKLVGKTGNFPPNYISGFDYSRKYIIPKSLLNLGAMNTIAVRVFDGGGEGGIIYGSVKIGINEDIELLDLSLMGKWKFHLHSNNEWKNKNYDDSHWDEIYVPGYWENQGYTNHDGFAWYRKSFEISKELIDKDDLYMILGKIDDEDKVYLNGELIGTVDDLKYDSFHNRTMGEWNIRRSYEIPHGLLKPGINVIAVKVYDGQIGGGIYDGPVGIMTERNYYKYQDRHRYEKSFWEEILYNFWD